MPVSNRIHSPCYQQLVRMAQSRYFLLAIIILALICIGETLAQWRQNQVESQEY